MARWSKADVDAWLESPVPDDFVFRGDDVERQAILDLVDDRIRLRDGIAKLAGEIRVGDDSPERIIAELDRLWTLTE